MRMNYCCKALTGVMYKHSFWCF